MTLYRRLRALLRRRRARVMPQWEQIVRAKAGL